MKMLTTTGTSRWRALQLPRCELGTAWTAAAATAAAAAGGNAATALGVALQTPQV
jgi:hypothetical protein